MSSRSKLFDLRSTQKQLEAEGKMNQAWDIQKQADVIEKNLLNEEIAFYTVEYLNYLEQGNKSELKAVGTLLRKKQVRLENIF